jgi:SAM-dependent methyltransferase
LDPLREFYRDYHDAIQDKRLDSPYPLRSYVHRAVMSATIDMVRSHVTSGVRILDAGCGEGALVMALARELAERDVRVVGVDISKKNLAAGLGRLRRTGDGDRASLLVADLEHLPFPDDSFDIVVSSHVLEHLPHFGAGLSELRRVTRELLILGLPTCLNPSAMAILGGDAYWTLSRRTPYAFFVGLGRVVRNLGGEGVDEGYIGRRDLTHLWRYPWVMRRAVAGAGFTILEFEAPTLALPYLPALLPFGLGLQRALDRLRRVPGFRNLGYGSLLSARKSSS